MLKQDFITRHPRLLWIKEAAKRISDKKFPVLITGESGVGKEVFAGFIHDHSSQQEGPFVKINCAELPNELVESELFGYEPGASTGAMNDKPGKFELADNGTLLLDEIGKITPHFQATLLRVLYNHEYSRLGGKRVVHLNARILSSTKVNLGERVKKGAFSLELYIKLGAIHFDIPPLYQRREDIPILCNYFLQKYRDFYKSTVEEISPALMDSFLRHDWPGNVRELENAVKRLVYPELDSD
jgi:transcriptional regulator with PAS, ATPase and Fis domain